MLNKIIKICTFSLVSWSIASVTVHGTPKDDSFVDDYLKKPWKLLPVYQLGSVLVSLATHKKITPHEALSATGLLGTVAVASIGERNTDRLTYKSLETLTVDLTEFVSKHECGKFLATFSPITEFVCHPYAFNFRTMEDVEIPFMAGCLGLDAGSLLLPILVDLGTIPFQALCSEWYAYRVNLYAHLRGVHPDDYEYLLDLPPVDAGVRTERGVLRAVVEPAGHVLLKIMRPQRLLDATATSLIERTFSGPTGKALSGTARNKIASIARRSVEDIALDPQYKLTQNKLHTMVRRYFFAPDIVFRDVRDKLLTKPEKINLVQQALAKYKPHPF